MSARFVFGSSAAYLIMTIAERAVTLILFPVMTRTLTPGDYGVMLLVGNGAALINLLFGFSLAQALPTLFSNAGTTASRRIVCTTILVSIAVILCALYSATAVFSRQISVFFLQTPIYASAIAIGSLSAFLNACVLCVALIVRLTERHTLYLTVQLPALMLQVAVIFSLLFIGALNVTSQYAATAAAGLFSLTIYAVVLRNWLSGPFKTGELIRASVIGAQMLPWQIATLLATNSAAFFFTRAGHLEEAGLFLVASGAAGLIVAASSSFTNVWTPFVLLRKNQADLASIQVRIFSLYSSTLLVAASALSLFAHEVFTILAGPAFQAGYRLVPVLVLAYCLFGFSEAFAQGLQANQRTVHYSWIGIAASAVFLAIALPLAKILGALGIATAMIGCFLTMLILLQLASRRFMPVSYPWGRHCLMWLVGIAIVLPLYQIGISWSGAAAKVLALICVIGLPFIFRAVHLSDLRLAKASLFR